MPETLSIILSGGTPAEIAPAMAKLFAIDPRLAGQIAGAAPIVLVENLTQDQAGGVRAALGELVAAGADITVKAGSVGSIPKVGWGGVPKVAGKPVSEYTAPAAAAAQAKGTFCCPACGASFKLVREGASSAVAGAPVKQPPKMGIKDSGFEEIPLPQALKALESPAELPDIPDVPGKPGAAKPAAPVPVGGAISARNVKPGASAPMALEEFEAGLASDDNVLADLDEGLPEVPDEPPRPVPAKPSGKKPLVEVHGLDQIGVEPREVSAKPAPAAKPAAPSAKPPARPAAPAPAARPAAAPAAKPAPAPAPEGSGGDPNEKVNIFASASNNPKMAELLSKIRGVSIEEAEELARKPLVAVAKNISRRQAEVIRKKFSENRISVRLDPIRASQRMSPPDLG